MTVFEIHHVDQCSQLTISLADVDQVDALRISTRGAPVGTAGRGLELRIEAPGNAIRLAATEVDLLVDFLWSYSLDNT